MNSLFSSYRGGATLVLVSLITGFIGTELFNESLSSHPIVTYAFVAAITTIGLLGALAVARTFYMRHNVFRKRR